MRIISLQTSCEAFEVSCFHPSTLLRAHQSVAAPRSLLWHCIKHCAYCRMYCEHKSLSLASSDLLEHSLNFNEPVSMRLFFCTYGYITAIYTVAESPRFHPLHVTQVSCFPARNSCTVLFLLLRPNPISYMPGKTF